MRRMLAGMLCAALVITGGAWAANGEGSAHAAERTDSPAVLADEDYEQYAYVCNLIDEGKLTAKDLISMEDLTGWASVAGDGLETTTGGGDATPQAVTEFMQFWQLAEDNVPRVLVVVGTISCPDDYTAITIGRNKTIVGIDENATIEGGVDLNHVSNVIISNLNFHGSYSVPGPDDTIGVRDSHHIWFDHLNIWDARDGNLDFGIGSDYLTVSWCKFWYSNEGHSHRLCSLVGSGTGHDNTDKGKLNATYHHNWFAERVDQRMPRVLYGKGHLYNNYYTSTGNSYCIGAGCYASVLIENNYFYKVRSPHQFMYTNALPTYITARDNVYDQTTGTKAAGYGGPAKYKDRVTAFEEPPYEYVADPAEDIPKLVSEQAGPHTLAQLPPRPTEEPEPTPTPRPTKTPRPTSTPKPAYEAGDVTMDGSVTAEDALAVLKDVVKLQPLSKEQKALAEVSGDKEVTAEDALLILKYVVRLIERF